MSDFGPLGPLVSQSFAQILCGQDLSKVSTGQIILKYWAMVDVVLKLCRVSKQINKMLESKAGLWACPKPPKFLLFKFNNF